jgi:hypothetical protein
MSLGTARLARLVPLVSLAAACSSATVPDAGSPDAAAPRPDATAHADAQPAPDGGVTVDGSVDSGAGTPDADEPPDDAGAGDATAGDATPVGPCGPVDLAQGPARFTEALGAWVARCNPELTPNEARSIGTFIAYLAAPAFENVTLSYDATAAGQCRCAIADAPCDSLVWLRALDACDAAFVSTATTGDACTTDFDCPTRHRCAEPQKGVAFALTPPLSCGRGLCQRFVGLGEPCSAEAECEPGTYCVGDAAPAVCAARANLGEDCSQRPCAGDVTQVLILPPNQCSGGKSAPTCTPRGRVGGRCDVVECHELYRCDNNLDCQPIPGEGEACPNLLSVNPGVIARELAIYENTYACRGNIGVGLGAGTYCTPTSSTTAVCRTQPLVGQPCGLGANLAPFCAPDAYCPGIDPQTFAPVSSVCVPRGTETSTCVGRPFSTFVPNQECEPGTTCTFDVGTGESRCVDVCGGGA